MAELFFTADVVDEFTPNNNCRNGNSIASDKTEKRMDSRIVIK
jgi:hypothetical protein